MGYGMYVLRQGLIPGKGQNIFLFFTSSDILWGPFTALFSWYRT